MKTLALLLALVAIAPAASVQTLVGTGQPGYSDTQVNNPYGMVIGPDGALYFCDLGNQVIRRLDLKTKKMTLVAGTPGKRFVLPHTRVLLHQGSAGIGGTAIDIEIQAENLEHTKRVMLGLIAQHSGQPAEKVERDSRRDRWFSAQEAVDYGLADAVLAAVPSVAPGRRGGGSFGLAGVSA
mgnify:CR=1 FL=1